MHVPATYVLNHNMLCKESLENGSAYYCMLPT